MLAIEVNSLTKRYGSARGVEALTFSIERGEVFGYLGPNGSGKTTTLRCLMGLLRPTTGRCRILGRKVQAGRATQHARIGYLPGDFRIWPACKSRRTLGMLGALGAGVDPAWQRTLARRLNLDLDRRVGVLSKGNRQKVGLLYALQHRPEVLILDEPTSGLDPLMRQTVLDLIREAAGDGATVLLSSHDLGEVAAVCYRAAILREGRQVALAPISQLVRQGERRIRVWFVPGRPLPAVPADSLPGVRVIRRQGTLLELAYHGAVDAVLKRLARYPVERIATAETSLEEAFMHYYQEGDTHGA